MAVRKNLLHVLLDYFVRQDAGERGNTASGEIRGMATYGRAPWGVVAASARCKALISLGFSEIFKYGVLGG